MSYLTKEQIFAFIKSENSPVTKREIARAFNIKGGEHRVALKQILKHLEKDGNIVKQTGGVYSAPQGLPSVSVIEVLQIGVDGDVFAKPLEWDKALQGPMPRIEIVPDQKNFNNIREHSRALCRLSQISDNNYEARIIRLIDAGDRAEEGHVIGIVHLKKGGATLSPTNRKAKYNFEIAQSDLNGASDGDLATAQLLSSQGLKSKKVKIMNVVGRRDDPGAISLISLHEAGLSDEFPDVVNEAAKGLKVPPLNKREDLQNIPLVTIDGADARDFDDAVFAEKLDDGGFHLIVAIADVSHYVREGSIIDKEAQKRGNSTYFPDRVVPMLPEDLSNDLCSLRPHEPRAALAAHMWIDGSGKLIRYKFTRALIKSAARLVYEQVQAARDGQSDEITKPLMDNVIAPLYAAYETLDQARRNRGALDLDLPERQIIIDKNGRMSGVRTRSRMDAHKVIEEFMILANVAAAKALEDKNTTQKGSKGGRGQYPCVYRIHDKPSYDKLESARDFLESFDLSLPKGESIKPKQINNLLQQASKSPYSHLISQMILRTQSQAIYSIDNIGHFGLALDSYGHFTSPIRRYADLLVHRSLVGAYNLGEGGLNEHERARIEEICQHISGTERSSMEAERSSVDRFTASYLSSHIDAEFDGKINGVTRFGLFVTLDENGADGLIPMKSMGDDFYIHDEKAHALVGRKRRKVFRLGAKVRIKIKEADGITGSCVFNLVGHRDGADIPGLKPPQAGKDHGHRGKGKPHKGRKKPSKTHKKAQGKTGNRPPSRSLVNNGGGKKR